MSGAGDDVTEDVREMVRSWGGNTEPRPLMFLDDEFVEDDENYDDGAEW